MKLTELNPRWWAFEAAGPRVGLSFDCPHCRIERLAVAFHHRGHEAIEDASILAHHYNGNGGYIWTLNGQDDFATLTLTPSIDASRTGHWHGFITNGEVTNA